MSISLPGPQRRFAAALITCLLVPAVAFGSDAPRHAAPRSTPVALPAVPAIHPVPTVPVAAAAAPLHTTPPAQRPRIRDYARETVTLPSAAPAPNAGAGSGGYPSQQGSGSGSSQGGSSGHRHHSGGSGGSGGSGSGYTASGMAYNVLSMLNSERSRHGLRALNMNGELVSSAHQHNLAMARADQMSHQLPGEPYFTTRIQDAGYSWQYAGENIGWNSDTSTSGALQLESVMYGEGPGGDHYENIVDSHYVDVGIDVYIDTVHHTLWLTEDFGAR